MCNKILYPSKNTIDAFYASYLNEKKKRKKEKEKKRKILYDQHGWRPITPDDMLLNGNYLHLRFVDIFIYIYINSLSSMLLDFVSLLTESLFWGVIYVFVAIF